MRVAIIGFGPRGLGALEALVSRWHRGALKVEIFEPNPFLAAGPNFSPDEHPGCLLNLPLRDVSLPTPETSDFPSFADWTLERDENRFLPRATLGQYLAERFARLRSALPKSIQLTTHSEYVTGAERCDAAKWRLVAGGTDHARYDAVLLTIGQPDTAPDQQLARWRAHASQHGLSCFEAYPTAPVVTAADGWADKTVAIRGLGLSTLDMLSLLTTGRGGVMRDGRYHASGKEPRRILPFSLDGKAPAPKPATAGLAAKFRVLPSESAAFDAALRRALAGEDAEAAQRHIAMALHAPVARISGMDPTSWLDTELSDPGTQRRDDPVAALHADIAIATGGAAPSVGYTAGQVWRAWQRPLRETFRTTDAAPSTRMAIVAFDAGLKRYSYGPPVSDATLLAALIEADRVRLTVADDPDISLSPSGWVLDAEQTAQVMINGVLPSPALSAIRAPLVVDLLDTGTLTPMGDSGGARTGADGQVVAHDGTPIPGLALIGRLAEGSVIAADSIHDCFGGTATAWAARIAR